MLWDLPTRVFHWALAGCIVGSSVSANLLEMDIHARFGVSILGLLLFRLLWGIWGPPPARFTQFLVRPAALLQYLRRFWQALHTRKHPVYATHNPLGGWAVLVILLLLMLQVGSGLFANDDVLFEGPLAQFAPNWSDAFTRIHHLNLRLLLAWLALHIAAVLWHQFYWREPLLRRMVQSEPQPSAMPTRHTNYGLALLVLCQLPCWSLLQLLP